MQKNIVVGSVKATLGMALMITGLAFLHFIYWDWPVEFYVSLPCCVIGFFLIIWGAYDIKYGEDHAEGWNLNTIQPSSNDAVASLE